MAFHEIRDAEKQIYDHKQREYQIHIPIGIWAYVPERLKDWISRVFAEEIVRVEPKGRIDVMTDKIT